jgi:hypothetical protein
MTYCQGNKGMSQGEVIHGVVFFGRDPTWIIRVSSDSKNLAIRMQDQKKMVYYY